jgi:MFS family permease
MHAQQEPSPYRWVILVAVCMMGFMLVGMRETIGNFFKTIIADMHWDRGTLSFVIAVNLWLSGLLQPFTGNIMDRFGARGLFTVSVALYGLGVCLISLTHSVWYLVAVYGVLVGSATAGASVGLTNTLVAQWFPAQRRALAISLNNSAVALGRFMLIFVSLWLLQTYGWRLSHLYLGVAILLVAIPMALLIPRRRAATGGPTPAALQQPTARAPLEVNRWSESLHSAPLWQIMGGYFVCGMTVNLSIHFIPFATDRNFTQEAAAAAMSCMSIAMVIGSVLSGLVSDRVGRKNILALAYALRAVAFAVLLWWHHWLALYVFAIIGGMSWLATPPSVTALTGEIYGMRTLGTLGGISLLAHQIGGGASVWLAGALYDLTGSYDISFILAIVGLIGAALVSFAIAERRYSVRYVKVLHPPVPLP